MELSGSLLRLSLPLCRDKAVHPCEFMVHTDDLPSAAVRIRLRVSQTRSCNYRPIAQLIPRVAIQFNLSICTGAAREGYVQRKSYEFHFNHERQNIRIKRL